MKIETIHLLDIYPDISTDGCDPIATVYLPSRVTEKSADKKMPCIVICPGGAYLFVSKTEEEPVALHFLTLGYCVITLKYSVNPIHFPQQLREVAAVFNLIHQKADEWKCDTNKIAIMGFSAGGHLAAHYTNQFDCEEIEEVFDNAYRPNACILCYPVITTNSEIAHRNSFKYLLGEFPKTDNKRFSLENSVTEDTPPTFIWHTSLDENVNVENSLCYAKALSRNKVPYELHIFPFGIHGLSTCDDITNNSVDEKAKRNNIWLDLLKDCLKFTFADKTE